MFCIKKTLWFLRIEWHWRFILRYRKKMKPLLRNGIPNPESTEYTQILKWDQKNGKHCSWVTRLTQEYLAM